MRHLLTTAVVFCATVPSIVAQGNGNGGKILPFVDVSLGLRETGAGGSTFTGIGDTDTGGGAIEWVNRDGQQLILDGSWQMISWNLNFDPVLGFTGNSALDGTHGVIEHIRIRNNFGGTDGITLWMDDLQVTETGLGAATTTLIQNGWEGFALGDEVVFQEPSFSGSTASNLVPGTSLAVVDTNESFSGSASYRGVMQFVDNDPLKWCRWTTFSAGGIVGGSPQVPFPTPIFLPAGGQDGKGLPMTSVTISVMMRGEYCPANIQQVCSGALHSAVGPLASFTGLPTIGGSFTIDATSLRADMTALLAGLPSAPTPIVGAFPGAVLCVDTQIAIPFSGVFSASVPVTVPNDPGQCGFTVRMQWVDVDPMAPALVSIPVGLSDAYDLTVGF